MHDRFHTAWLISAVTTLAAAEPASPGDGHHWVEVGPNVLVSGDRPRLPHVEPHLAINPNDPGHLVVASIVGGFEGCAVFVSFDGGNSWKSVRSPGLHDLAGFGDPWVAFGSQSDVFLVGLGNSSNALVWRSRDGGLAWSQPSRIPGGAFDHPSIVIDRHSKEPSGIVFVLAAQTIRRPDGTILNPVVLARSTNDGLSFEKPRRILPTNLKHMAGTPQVLTDGSVVLLFIDYSTERTTNRLLRTRRLWTVRSTDHGESFSLPAFVGEVTDFRTAFVTLAVDATPTSPFKGRLYVASVNIQGLCADVSEWEKLRLLETPIGVLVNSSQDQGATWSAPRLVAAGMAEARYVTIAVNREGVLGVAWQQRTRKADTCFEPFFTASMDGGKTFHIPIRLANTETCSDSDTPGNVHEGFDVADRWPAGGDYFGMVSDSTGLFHLVWPDSRTGVFQLWAAKVAVK